MLPIVTYITSLLIYVIENTLYMYFVKQSSQFFTALHRYSDENSVCPSVKRVHCDKIEKYVQIVLYHTKYHLTKFSEKKNGW